MMSHENILFVGQIVPGSRTLQRINALEDLDCRVKVISTSLPDASYEDRPSMITRIRHRLRLPEDKANANGKIITHIKVQEFDIIWLERAVEIKANTLRQVKKLQPNIVIVWYAEDDMMNPRHLSRYVQAALPLYDLWVTTKSFNADSQEMPARGVRRILFVNNSFDPSLHRPVILENIDHKNFGSDVSFVGTYERERAQSLIYLAENGVKVRVWGNGWSSLVGKYPSLLVEDRPVYDEDYGKVVCASKINLCFLRKDNRDLQTCRSIEIPAFGGFMLHERNDEICSIFAENVDSAYFESDQELLDQCRKYLSDDGGRINIAAAGHRTVTAGSYSHPDRLKEILAAAKGKSEW